MPGAVRIIRGLYPPIDLFEDIADPADWPLLIATEQKTNPRIMETIGNLDLVPENRRVSGSGSSYLMAPSKLPCMICGVIILIMSQRLILMTIASAKHLALHCGPKDLMALCIRACVARAARASVYSILMSLQIPFRADTLIITGTGERVDFYRDNATGQVYRIM